MSTLPGPTSYDDLLAARLLHQRVVAVRDELDERACDRACAALLVLAGEDAAAPVALHLTARAGSAAAAQTLAATIDLVPVPVTTLALGPLGGGAVLVLAAGAAGRRLALPHADLTLPAAAGAGLGRAGTRPEPTLAELVGERTGWRAPQGRTTLSPEQAREAGLLDRVLRTTGDVSPGRVGAND